jgi:hypothetical protein
MQHMGGERIVLTLEAKPSHTPLAVRLRWVLKRLLRDEQLKCLAVEWDPPHCRPHGWPSVDPKAAQGANGSPNAPDAATGQPGPLERKPCPT